jgi:outer membrane protein OmpA-like peptidoglycan-associated protein
MPTRPRPEATPRTARTTRATDDDENEDADEDADGGAAGGTTPSVIPAPPTDAPYVDATLTDNVFVLSGRVPDAETKLALETRAEIAYAPFFTSELEVDESIDPAAWLEAAPQVVGLLPMITDGTIRLQDDAIAVAGRSPNPEYAANFEGALSLITGLPFTGSSIEITGLVPPRFVATVTDGTVLLEGEVPSEAIGQTFVQGAAAVYGPENVSSTMTVDDGTYTSFWMYTMPGIFQLFQPFTAYEIQVENGITSGAMQGGVLFDVNSADITEQAAQVLGVGVALLVRDQSLDMTVIGHTDSQGPRELNQELSVRRAQSVVQFLVANGVPEGRLTADGKGPDEPIASNDDEVGRALNRRVEFLFD